MAKGNNTDLQVTCGKMLCGSELGGIPMSGGWAGLELWTPNTTYEEGLVIPWEPHLY